MNDNASNKIELIVREDEHAVRGDRLSTISKKLDVTKLHEKFSEFMGNLQSIVSYDIAEELPFELGEIQFSAEITANGDFKLMGTGVGVEVGSAVTFVLKRKG